MVAWIAIYTKAMQKQRDTAKKDTVLLALDTHHFRTLSTKCWCHCTSVDTVSPMLAVEVWCPPQLITRDVIWCKLSAKLCHLVVKPYCIQAFKGPKLAFRSSWADNATQKNAKDIQQTAYSAIWYMLMQHVIFLHTFSKNDCLFSILQGWLT